MSFPIQSQSMRDEIVCPFYKPEKLKQMDLKKGVRSIEKCKFVRLLRIAKKLLPEGGKTCFVKV